MERWRDGLKEEWREGWFDGEGWRELKEEWREGWFDGGMDWWRMDRIGISSSILNNYIIHISTMFCKGGKSCGEIVRSPVL